MTTTSHKILNILCSLPIILIILYFIPTIGIILLFIKSFINKRKYTTPIILIIFGLLITIPFCLDKIFNILDFNPTNIPYFNRIITSEIYSINLIKYSKLLISLGLIFLIINSLIDHTKNKLITNVKSYFQTKMANDREISAKNDLIIKEKQEKAKNTHVVYCPFCGADNIIYGSNGKCTYCRKSIIYKEKDNINNSKSQ